MINLNWRSGHDLTLRIVERPDVALDAAEIAVLLADLRHIAALTLNEDALAYGVLGGDVERLRNCVVTIVYQGARKGSPGRPVAFNILSLLDVDLAGRPANVMHLGLVMVDPAFRGRGLSATLYGLTCVLMFLAGQGRPLWISNVSQVPAVVGMVAETFSDVFPSPRAGTRRSFDHLTLARQIMARHRAAFGVGPEAGFDEARFVITDAYTGGSDALKKTFEQAAPHRIEAYNAFCRERLDYRRGDDLIQIGRIDMAAAGRYLRKVAPPTTAMGLGGLVVIMAARMAVLPLIYWLSTSRPWGVLRPWRDAR
ncbi:MAG: hypothetical protein EON91_10135 [Brevundimonas sp.]|uniref:hypothetical protein n=1 Tax=Brevundimonas sp. TaxID=1871086 RepID=UPI0011F72850|nr:hypothetical protein [Brevundimonas sp.]RZJ17233.1 MAG: hypothetical protein EON91_10135 [Brevundimonas sp.]